MNLLIPAIGKKIYLAQQLRAELHARGGRLFAADLADTAPALAHVDQRIVLPPFGSARYWPVVEQAIREREIAAVVPARDAELVGWAERAESGQVPARVVLSPSRTLRMCRDKGLLYRAALKIGVRSPEWQLLAPGEPLQLAFGFPVVAKPLRGAGSRDVVALHNPDELAALLQRSGTRMLVQRYVEGEEYSIDCYARADGTLVACCPRRRVVVRDGECVVGEPVDDPGLVGICGRLAKTLAFRGVINVQVIKTAQGPRLIDLNPRFPGGIAITEAAGLRFVQWTVRELCGEPLPDDGRCS